MDRVELDMQLAACCKKSIVVGMFVASCIANAQPATALDNASQAFEGNLFTLGHRETADGRISGCGLEFGALKRDFATKQGAPSYVMGSFYIRPHPSAGVAYVLKTGIFELNHNGTGIPPANAFVRAPRGEAPKKGLRVASDNPSYALFVGGLSPEVVEVLKSIAEAKVMVVGFNRLAGQQDVAVELDLTVVDTKAGTNGPARQHSDKPVDDFMACVADLLKRVK